jgi:hypothetical protein
MKLLKITKQTERTSGKFSKIVFRNFGAAAVMLSAFLFLASCNTAEERVDKVGGVRTVESGGVNVRTNYYRTSG